MKVSELLAFFEKVVEAGIIEDKEIVDHGVAVRVHTADYDYDPIQGTNQHKISLNIVMTQQPLASFGFVQTEETACDCEEPCGFKHFTLKGNG